MTKTDKSKRSNNKKPHSGGKFAKRNTQQSKSYKFGNNHHSSNYQQVTRKEKQRNDSNNDTNNDNYNNNTSRYNNTYRSNRDYDNKYNNRDYRDNNYDNNSRYRDYEDSRYKRNNNNRNYEDSRYNYDDKYDNKNYDNNRDYDDKYDDKYDNSRYNRNYKKRKENNYSGSDNNKEERQSEEYKDEKRRKITIIDDNDNNNSENNKNHNNNNEQKEQSQQQSQPQSHKKKRNRRKKNKQSQQQSQEKQELKEKEEKEEELTEEQIKQKELEEMKKIENRRITHYSFSQKIHCLRKKIPSGWIETQPIYGDIIKFTKFIPMKCPLSPKEYIYPYNIDLNKFIKYLKYKNNNLNIGYIIDLCCKPYYSIVDVPKDVKRDNVIINAYTMKKANIVQKLIDLCEKVIEFTKEKVVVKRKKLFNDDVVKKISESNDDNDKEVMEGNCEIIIEDEHLNKESDDDENCAIESKESNEENTEEIIEEINEETNEENTEENSEMIEENCENSENEIIENAENEITENGKNNDNEMNMEKEEVTTSNEETSNEENNDNNNYILVHCTHGLNRTGLFICFYLLYTKKVNTVPEALELFKNGRKHSSGLYNFNFIDLLFEYFEQTDNEMYQLMNYPKIPEHSRQSIRSKFKKDRPYAKRKNPELCRENYERILGFKNYKK